MVQVKRWHENSKKLKQKKIKWVRDLECEYLPFGSFCSLILSEDDSKSKSLQENQNERNYILTACTISCRNEVKAEKHEDKNENYRTSTTTKQYSEKQNPAIPNIVSIKFR